MTAFDKVAGISHRAEAQRRREQQKNIRKLIGEGDEDIRTGK
jgi:hypothetical protein